MDRDAALGELPVTYATALRLEASGAPEALIASGLGIPEAGVARFMAMAHRKLDRILAADDAALAEEA